MAGSGIINRLVLPTFLPKQSILFIVTIVFLLNTLVIYGILNQPGMGVKFELIDGVIHASIRDEGAVISRPSGVISGIGVNGNHFELELNDFLEEPDLFAQYAEYNRFMQRQSQLFALLKNPQVDLLWVDGSVSRVDVRKTEWGDLPVLFWIQLLVATISLIIGSAVWLFKQRDQSAFYYFQTGVFLAVTIFPAAIYSSRGLALDGDFLRLLSVIDHLGLYLLIASLVSLIWSYPQPLKAIPVPVIIYSLMFLCWLADTLQWFSSLDVSTRIIPLLMLLLGFLLLFIHWNRSAGNALYRQSIKWFLLVILVGCSLFVGVVFVPPLFGLSPLISQGLAFIAFLSIYISLAVGVVRYQLFDLDRWWFNVWIWIAVGSMLVGFDILFISLLNLSNEKALWIALIVSGWLYFPLRQWVLVRLLSDKIYSIESYLPMVVRNIATARGFEELSAGCRVCLESVFSPLSSTMHTEFEPMIAIYDHGLSMHIPFPRLKKTLELKCPGEGRLLFHNADIEIVQALMNLFEQAYLALEVRDDATRLERERIKQDIHDTLGGRLLSIMRQNDEPLSAKIATSAWRELRDILSALEGKNAPLIHVLDQWHKDALQKFENIAVVLKWDISSDLRDREWEIDGNQRLNLGQIIRESLTNAMRHSTASQVTVNFSVQNEIMFMTICNDGVSSKPAEWVAGRGLHHINKRSEKLGTTAKWKMLDDSKVELSLKLAMKKVGNG